MRVFILCVLALVQAVREPAAITPAEESDEVAMAQQRAVWLACMTLTQSLVESRLEVITSKAKTKLVDVDSVIKKFSVESLEVCEKKIGYELAEKIISGEDSEEVKALKQKGFTDLLEKDVNSFEITEGQKDLINRILEEIKRKDDGFDQDPPVVPEIYDIRGDNKMLIGLVGAIGVLILALWMCSGDGTGAGKKPDEKDNKKKKRD